jgi:hypothetical protein
MVPEARRRVTSAQEDTSSTRPKRQSANAAVPERRSPLCWVSLYYLHMAERIGPRLQRLISVSTGSAEYELSLTGPHDIHLPEKVPAPSTGWGTRLQDGEIWVDLVAIANRSQDLPNVMVIDTVVVSQSRSEWAFVTGRVPLSAIGAAIDSPVWEFVDTPSPVRMELNVSGPDVGFPAVHNDPACPLTGTGVFVGIVDRGVDIAHPGLCDSAGNTRIVQLWDQQLKAVGPELPPRGRGYGVGWGAGDIDAGLAAGRHAGSTHGTQVAGIATGNGRDAGSATTTYVGGAPEAQIVAVAVDTATGLSNSKHVVDAVDFVFEVAECMGMPAVVNLSLGDPSGPHDGTAWLEQTFASFIQPTKLIVKSAGNGGGDGGHAACDIAAGVTVDLCFDIPVGSPSLQCLQVWYTYSAQLDVQVVPPGGSPSRVVLANSLKAILPCGRSIAMVHSEIGCLCNGDNCITVSLIGAPVLTHGTWALRLNNPGSQLAHVDAWFDAATKGPVFLPPWRNATYRKLIMPRGWAA